MRAVLYARFSSDLQRVESIADQHRILRDALPRLAMQETSAHSDAAISGASFARPGLEAALAEIEAGRADVLLAEALDRISRDLEHVARVAKRVAYRGARIVTLAEGEIGALHIGLAGTMAQLYIEQLAEKTRRGLRGVAAEGRIAAGRAYGYRPTSEKGVFEIVEEEAAIVRRICTAYAGGQSPRGIAMALNADGVQGPRGALWKANTIVGERAAGTGIVNNRLYAGEIVWNRSTWRKDPATGKRRPFQLPESEWVVTLAPQMRIVPDDLWQLVRQRQGVFVQRGTATRATRPLSGLLVCGTCGTKLTIVGRARYGCPRHKETGMCSNGRTAPAEEVERRVLDGLRASLCRPELVELYAAAYVEERKRLRAAAASDERRLARELGEAEREQAQALDMLGKVPAAAVDALAARIGQAAERIVAIKAQLDQMPGRAEVVDLKHISGEHLARNLERIWADLSRDDAAAGRAHLALSAMIRRIVLVPGEVRGRYTLDVEGDIAAFLGVGSRSDMVAGARNQLNLLFQARRLRHA